MGLEAEQLVSEPPSASSSPTRKLAICISAYLWLQFNIILYYLASSFIWAASHPTTYPSNPIIPSTYIDSSIHLSSLHPPTHTYTPTYPSFPSDTLIHLPSSHPPTIYTPSIHPAISTLQSIHCLLIQLQFPSIHHLHILPLTTQSAINSIKHLSIHTYICVSTYLF